MSLADIKKRIEKDAKQEALSLLAKADAQAKVVLQEAAEAAVQTENNLRAKLAKDEPEIFRRREVVARLDVRKVDLGAKQELIDQSFAEALKKLQSMDKKKYMSFCGKLLEKAIVTGDEFFIVGQEEKNLDSAWLESFNQKNTTRLVFDENRLPIKGGFILRRGLVDVNCSFEMLVRSLREELEKDVVTRLFSS